MTTTKKLLLGFGTLAVLLLLFTIALTVRLRSIENNVEQQTTVAQLRGDETRQIEIHLLGYALAVRAFVQTGDPSSPERLTEEAAAVERHLAEYERLAITQRQTELAAGAWQRWRSFHELSQNYLNANEKTRTPADALRIANDRLELERFLSNEMQTDATETYNARLQTTLATVRSITTLALILVVFFIVIASMISGIVGQSIVGTERSLRESREQLHVTLASISDAVITTDADGRITFLNQTAETMTGWTLVEAEGQHASKVLSIIDERTREAVETPVEKVLRIGGITAVVKHTVLIARDGREIPIDDSGAPIRDGRGDVRGVVVVVRDITEQKWNEQNLVESEERFRAIFNQATAGFAQTDLSGKFVLVNDRYCDIVGYTREELLKIRMQDITVKEDVGQNLVLLKQMLETSKPFVIEKRYQRKDGSVVWVNNSVSTIRGADGNPKFVLAVSLDITGRKHEESRVALLAQLGEITSTISDPAALLFAVSSAVGENLRLRRCLFNEIDLENDLEIVHRDYCRGVKSVAGRHLVTKYSPVTTADMRAGRTVVNFDSKNDPRTAKYYETAYEPAAERSYVAVPLLRGGQWVASLWASDELPRSWSDEEVRLLENIGERAWLAVEKLRSDAALRASEKRFREMVDALKKSEERFARFMHHLPGLAWIKDLEGRYIYANDAAESAFRTPRECLYGKTDAEVFPAELAARYRENDEKALAAGPAGVQAVETLEQDDGVVHHSIVCKFPISGPDGEIILIGGMAVDITERQRIEEELRRSRAELETRVAERTAELAQANIRLKAENAERLRIEQERVDLLKRMVTTQEDERRRIARDLHDELGQQLTALRLKLRSAREICDEGPTRAEIDETQRIAERLDADVGFMAWELRPAALEETGLPAALNAFVKEWVRFSAIKAEFRAFGFNNARLEPDAEINLYRIVQEALNNVLKYAKAKNVSVLLENRKYDVALIIEDDGIGFDPESTRNGKKRLGLAGMRERAALLGGHLEIESTRGAGTTIFVHVPTRTEARKAKKSEAGQS